MAASDRNNRALTDISNGRGKNFGQRYSMDVP